MHYIIGTSFTVTAPTQQTSRYNRFFVQGNTYRIVHLTKEKDTIDYCLVDQLGNRLTVNFPSCRVADSFIAGCKRESIPDYENMSGRD